MPYANSTQAELAGKFLAHNSMLPLLLNGAMGSGKTSCSYEKAAQVDGVVLYAHPTYALIYQAFKKSSEYERHGLSKDDIGIFRARSAYVSPTRAQKFGIACQAGELTEAVIERNKCLHPNLQSHEICLKADCPSKEHKQYLDDKEGLSHKKVILCTHHALLIDAWSGGQYIKTPKEYVIIDEAHQIYHMARLWANRTIDSDDFEWLGGDRKRLAVTELNNEALEYAKKRAIARKSEDSQRSVELLAILNVMQAHLGRENQSYFGLGVTKRGWELQFRNPARIISRLHEQTPCAFISGTLSVTDSLDPFKAIINADKIDPNSGFVMPEEYGTAFFVQAARMNEDEADAYILSKFNNEKLPTKTNIPLVVAVAKHCQKTGGANNGNTLILTASADDTIGIGEQVPGCTFQNRGESVAMAISRYQGGVLVLHGGWEGLDIEGFKFDHVIIPRIPYPPPSEILPEFFDLYQQWVIRKMAQGIGRGLRSEDAVCTFWLLDKRFPLHANTCKHYGVSNRLMEGHLKLGNSIPKWHRSVDFGKHGYNKAKLCQLDKSGELEILA